MFLAFGVAPRCLFSFKRVLWKFQYITFIKITHYSVNSNLIGFISLNPTEHDVSSVSFSNPFFSFVVSFLTQTRRNKTCCLNNCASKCTKQRKLALNTSNSHLMFLCSALARRSCFIVLTRTFQCLKLFYLGAVPYMAWINKQNPTGLYILHVSGFSRESWNVCNQNSRGWSSLLPRDARTFDGVCKDDFGGSRFISGR